MESATDNNSNSNNNNTDSWANPERAYEPKPDDPKIIWLHRARGSSRDAPVVSAKEAGIEAVWARLFPNDEHAIVWYAFPVI